MQAYRTLAVFVTLWVWLAGPATAESDVIASNVALLEFLSMLEADTAAWDEFFDMASEGLPPGVLEQQESQRVGRQEESQVESVYE
jgi:hypothetical protein